jgi:HK97 family phage major capsid protein
MSKKIQELNNQIEQLKAEAREFVEANDMEKARAKADEAKNFKEQLDLMIEVEAIETNNSNGVSAGEIEDKDEQEKLYKNAFMKVFRGKKLTSDELKDLSIGEVKDAMSPKTDEDGGYLVPKDIQTAINQYKRALPELENLIEVIPTNLSSGTRVFEKLATMTPLENITDETADIDEIDSPKFEQISYTIKDYAGWMPIPNNLLADSDQNIMDYLKQWIARKSVVTRNSLIITLLKTLTKTTFADWKALKKALNVTIDPMLAANSVILTNQDGFQYFDTLVDGNNRPLLKEDVTQEGQKLLFSKPIVVVPNSVFATTGTTTKLAPCVVGDFRELAKMFERQGHLIRTTDIGGTAFRKNRTEIRVIEREDVVKFDGNAVVYGEIDVTATV